MYKYKRKINEIKDIRKSEIAISDKEDVCLSLKSDFSVTKPYNGLYIKNGKVIISNIFEEIRTKNSINTICNISPNSNNVSDSYISSIDLENLNIEYDMDNFNFSKRIYLEEKTGILAVEYYLKNSSKNNVEFRAYPAITYRDLYNMKNSSMLKFNQRNVKNGVIINLSVTSQEDVVLKSNKLTWNKDYSILNDVKYSVRNDNKSVENYKEDLIVPGYFDISLKPDSIVTCVIYITSKEIEISKLSTEEISKKDFFLKEKLQNSIEKEFIELKELTYGVDKLKLEHSLVSSLPYSSSSNLSIDKDLNIAKENLQNVLDVLTDLVKSIEGEYLNFNRVKEATKRVLEIKKYIDYIEKLNIEEYSLCYEFCILKLWYIESINRIIQKQDLFNVFFECIKYLVYSILNDKYYEQYMRNIEAISLMYNALKIYEDMLYKKGKEETTIFEKEKNIQSIIEKEFWNEEKRVMKKNTDEDEIYANVEMLYTLSLSYPCIIGNIQFKLLDTIFKELYTPYGLREYSKNSDKNTGLIYPKYMAHFVKANLRQNGVTRASKKIAYNLVKELLLDINKHVNCGVKKIYSEKGYQIDTLSYDLLTNCEIIRLYDMLT